jgi:OOP family OmpA-OmpF porin
MTRLRTIFLAAASLAILSGCGEKGKFYNEGGWNTSNYTSNYDVGQIRAMDSTGNAFQQALHNEYVALAQSSRDEQDLNDAGFFLFKARASAMGETLGPQRVPARNLPADKVSMLSAARARLIAHLNPGDAMTRAPKIAARAQAKFDCWMEQQEENHQPKDIEACKSAFFAALKELGPVKVMEKPMAAAPAPMPQPAPAPAPAPQPAPPMAMPGPFVVFFGFDSADLSAEAMATIRDAAAAVKNSDASKIFLSGHTDRSGANAYNMQLSRHRVAAVGNALMEAGVSRKLIEQVRRGEEQPAVTTADGMREAANRRVEISLQQ